VQFAKEQQGYPQPAPDTGGNRYEREAKVFECAEGAERQQGHTEYGAAADERHIAVDGLARGGGEAEQGRRGQLEAGPGLLEGTRPVCPLVFEFSDFNVLTSF
jgi:hypothetical protein